MRSCGVSQGSWLADFPADVVELHGRILAALEAWAVRADTAGSLDELQTSSEALA